jgi:dCTP deaminase
MHLVSQVRNMIGKIGKLMKGGVRRMGNPWDEWVPGVLNSRQMSQLLDQGFITYPGKKPDVGHSSMDLTLSDEAYQMSGGSVKPSQRSYSWFIKKYGLATELPKPENGVYELKRKTTYVFRLQERLDAALYEGGIYGQATAKSSVGRVDVLARLIVDGMNAYESFDPRGMKNASGHMYLEITPITFNVKVRVGDSLSQLRLFYGSPDDAAIHSEALHRSIFRGSGHRDGNLSVNLEEAVIGDVDGTPCKGVAFRSKKVSSGEIEAYIPLWSSRGNDPLPNPVEFWDIGVTDHRKRLHIEDDRFYILRSKEKLHVPKGIAIYCRASDETMGEMRIHYAGFVHPFFGLYRKDNSQGTPLIFEVRGHQVPVSLGHGEKLASLVFYRMSEDPADLTDDQIKDEAKDYGSQDLKLSTRFAEWPKHIKLNDDGTVEAVEGVEIDKVETK